MCHDSFAGRGSCARRRRALGPSQGLVKQLPTWNNGDSIHPSLQACHVSCFQEGLYCLLHGSPWMFSVFSSWLPPFFPGDFFSQPVFLYARGAAKAKGFTFAELTDEAEPASPGRGFCPVESQAVDCGDKPESYVGSFNRNDHPFKHIPGLH